MGGGMKRCVSTVLMKTLSMQLSVLVKWSFFLSAQLEQLEQPWRDWVLSDVGGLGTR